MSESTVVTPPKNFMAFLGKNYYPSGGMNDHVGNFDTLDAAIAHTTEEAKKKAFSKNPEKLWDDQWAHIFDIEKQEVVWEHYEI